MLGYIHAANSYEESHRYYVSYVIPWNDRRNRTARDIFHREVLEVTGSTWATVLRRIEQQLQLSDILPCDSPVILTVKRLDEDIEP